MTAGDQNPAGFTIYPVGVIKSQIKEPSLGATGNGIELKEHMKKVRQQHQWIKTLVSELEIFPDYDGILDGIEDFSHILVLYWPHLIDPERRNLRKVHPMGRKDLPIQGIFATRSPARPNPILVSTVPLLERVGNVLKVKGLEAVDGSPLINIKPYVEAYHGVDHPKVPEWMRQIHKDLEGT